MNPVKWLLFLLLLNTDALKAQDIDTLILYDYHARKNFSLQTGKSPLTLIFPQGDTLILDGGKPGSKKIGSWRDNNETANNYAFAEGVRILFPAGQSFCLRVKSTDEYKGRQFMLDTNLCITKNTLLPLIYWNALRQQSSNAFRFKPDSLMISNREFATGSVWKKRKYQRELAAAIRYEYDLIKGTIRQL